MNPILKAFCWLGLLLLSTNIVAQVQKRATFQIAFGGGVMIVNPQRFSYISIPDRRAPYEVIPPKQFKTFFPVSVHIRANLVQFPRSKMGIGLSFPINLAAFASTDNSRSNFLALQLPTLFTINWGDRAFPDTNNALGVYLGIGGAFNRLTGDDFENQGGFVPALEVGLRKTFNRLTLELSYNQSRAMDIKHFEDLYVRGDHFRIPNFKLTTQTYMLRFYLKPKK